MSSRGGSAWYGGGPEPRRAAADARGARQALVGKAMVLKAQRYTGLAAGVLERARNAFNWSCPAPSAPRACRVLPRRARFFVRRKQSAPKARPPARAHSQVRPQRLPHRLERGLPLWRGLLPPPLPLPGTGPPRISLRPAPCALRPARFILRPAPGPASGPRAERARARAFAGGLARFLAAAGECGGPGWLRPRVLFMTLGMTFPKDSVPWFGCAAHSQWVYSSSCCSSIKIGAPAAAAPAAAR